MTCGSLRDDHGTWVARYPRHPIKVPAGWLRSDPVQHESLRANGTPEPFDVL